MQGRCKDQHEAHARKNAVACRSPVDDIFPHNVSAWPAGDPSVDDEGHRAWISPNLKRTDMNDPETDAIVPDKPDPFWRRIYIAVIVTTFVVITLLWAFSRYFS